MNASLIKNRDIVIVGQQAWDTDIGSNCKNIAVEFSRSNRVLYVNPPLDRITFLKRRNDPKIKKRINYIKGKEDNLIQVENNLWNLFPDTLLESINWINNRFVFDFLNKRNNKLFAKTIKKAISNLNFNNIILFNDNDIFRSFYLKDLLKPAISLYYSRDFMIVVDYWKRHGKRLEPKLIKKSDVCVANSTYLANYCKKYNENSFYVGQGCEFELFSNAKVKSAPTDMMTLNSPIIGYVGALLSFRLDINLIKHIALSNPSWNIVLVGPEDDEFKESQLHSISNIFFLGSKSPEEIPQYINAFDVCINPQLVNEVTIGNYPRKIDEYLAMGKPVVATETQAMDIFKSYVYTGIDKNDFVNLIKKAIKEDSEELQKKRVQFALSHTWENSIKEIYKAVLSVNNKKDGINF